MTRFKIAASALLASYILSGCAGTSMLRGSAGQICQVSVVQGSAPPVVHPNPYSNAGSGAAHGAASGALSGAALSLELGFPTAVIFLAPILGVAGAVGGAACGDWVSKHPNADPGFAAVVRAADPMRLVQGLDAQVRAPRNGCAPLPAAGAPPATPDALLEIEPVNYTMNCPTVDQVFDYGVSVKWRAKSVRDGTLLRETAMLCQVTSLRPVDEWLADQERARLEVERVLTKVGQRIAMELTLPRDDVPGDGSCSILIRESGEIE